jgi:ribose transport system substrate-binding protein
MRRTQRKATLVIALSLVVAILAAACGDSSDEDAEAGSGTSEQSAEVNKTIAVVFPNASNPIVQTVLDAAKDRASERGYELLINDPGNDLNKQVAAVQSYIQQEVGAIVAVVPEPDVFKPLVQRAKDAGVAWVTYAGSLEGEDAFVSWPHREGGELLGKEAAEWINERGIDAKVGILGFEQGAWARERREGIEAAIKENAPDAEIVFRQDALLAPEGVEVVSTALQANPDLNVVLAISDTATEGAYQALRNAGKDADDPNLFVGGLDGSQRAEELMLDETFYRASAALDLTAIGKAVVDTPAEIIEGGQAEDAVIPYVLLEQSNPEQIEEFLALYKTAQ